MQYDPRETVGAISEQTLRNVRRAKTWGLWAGSVHIEWKWWTQWTRFKPIYSDRVVDWWEREDIYQVRWITIYWLRFGLSFYWPVGDPHERMNHVV